MNPVVYFRRSPLDTEEFDICSSYFKTVECRTEIPSGSLVIPRYSALPFYQELEKDVKNNGSRLINSFSQHSFVADIRKYAPFLGNMTPKTYSIWANLPEGSYVVKGITNSRKHEWLRRMFAKTVADIPRIVNSLLDDDLIKEQGVVVREFVPLKTFAIGINGLPITNEWRFFCLNGKPFIGGYYWSQESHLCQDDVENPPSQAWDLAKKACERIGEYIPFFVVDVAETKNGDWVVIELNDGQMAGPCMIGLDEFYSRLRKEIHQSFLRS